MSSALNAQEPQLDLDAWIDQRVDEYIERSGISTADRLLWCDPVPDCEAIPLKATIVGEGWTYFVVIVAPSLSHDEMEFQIWLSKAIRAAGGDVLGMAGMNYEAAVALRRRLTKRRDN